MICCPSCDNWYYNEYLPSFDVDPEDDSDITPWYYDEELEAYNVLVRRKDVKLFSLGVKQMKRNLAKQRETIHRQKTRRDRRMNTRDEPPCKRCEKLQRKHSECVTKCTTCSV